LGGLGGSGSWELFHWFPPLIISIVLSLWYGPLLLLFSYVLVKEDMYKKSVKAVFKLQRALSSSNPSISTFLHLYDHTIKPILIYGSEITGMFKTSSAACRKENEYLLQQIYINDFID
jgi:hypothetical protein